MEEKIKEIVELYKELEKDGWTKGEMVKFGLECLEILIPEAEQFADMAGSDKKKWVVETLEKAYFAVNPNIPYVPEPLETMIEKFTVKKAIEQVISPAIDWLVGFMRKKGII